MKCNIDPIVNAKKELDTSTEKLSFALDDDWDDEVKESYLKFISHCREDLERIQFAVSKMKMECEKLSGIDVDAMISCAEDICSEIERF